MIVSFLFLLRFITGANTDVRCHDIVTASGRLTSVRRTRTNRLTDRVRNCLSKGRRILNA